MRRPAQSTRARLQKYHSLWFTHHCLSLGWEPEEHTDTTGTEHHRAISYGEALIRRR